MATHLSWNPETTPSELQPILREIGQAYPVVERATGGWEVQFARSREPGVCQVERRGRTAVVTYHDAPQALRGVGALLAGFERLAERTPFPRMGIMLDCSRNAVMTVEHLKVWLRRLALLGYNEILLYTEDTYELPGEPWFGYQRGRYTAEELREIDALAARLGLEAIPCLQTLGHLEKILRHSAYRAVRDTHQTLMVGEAQTYELIEKMIRFWKEVYRTRRIHIGMDEADDIGRGRYLTLKGYRPAFELMTEHLTRVVGLCTQHGLRPMIWSDMYFRLGSKTHEYYDPNATIPEQAVRALPREVDLVYWDYYHDQKDFYREWIARHRAMGKDPIMASGIWTWNRYWYDHAQTVRTAGPCIEACREAGVQDIFFTQWGDNGAYCDHDSAFAGMAWCAERAYGHDRPDEDQLERRFAAVCGGSYRAHVLASEIHSLVPGFHPNLWDDPIFETHVRFHVRDDASTLRELARSFEKLARRLERLPAQAGPGHLAYAARTARYAADRYGLLADLLAAYRTGNRRRLRAAARRIPAVRRRAAAMAAAFRAMWMSHNKPEGIECIQGRFGTLDARYGELAARLGEYLAGKTSRIAEWDWPCPPA